jgi:hypothetical protein
MVSGPDTIFYSPRQVFTLKRIEFVRWFKSSLCNQNFFRFYNFREPRNHPNL